MRAASQVLEASIVPADDHWSEVFYIPRGAELVRLHRLRLSGDVPIAIQLTHLPHHFCPNLLEYDFSTCQAKSFAKYTPRLARSKQSEATWRLTEADLWGFLSQPFWSANKHPARYGYRH
jgi:DNA-binding GntR family transcriptional regulator